MDKLANILRGAIAIGLFWLCSLLQPIGKQIAEVLPVVIKQIDEANRNVSALTGSIKEWRLFQADERRRR